jgi:hypothetical protein
VSDEGYIAVRCRLERVEKASIWISAGTRDFSIPRSLIRDAAETPFDAVFIGMELTLDIADWKARELGIDNIRDDAAAVGDLFAGKDGA